LRRYHWPVPILTIHEPSTIRDDVSLGDVEVEITQDLHHLQQNAILVHAVNLNSKGEQRRNEVISQHYNLSLELKRWELGLTFTKVLSLNVLLSMHTLQNYHSLFSAH
jgi:hypothetical protein